MDIVYQSTQRYTVEKFTDMGSELYRVTDSTGMVAAILMEPEFLEQFEPVPGQ